MARVREIDPFPNKPFACTVGVDWLLFRREMKVYMANGLSRQPFRVCTQWQKRGTKQFRHVCRRSAPTKDAFNNS